jgi:hypothetical protein
VAVLSLNRATKTQIETLRNVLKNHPGEYEVRIEIKAQNGCQALFLPLTIDPSPAFIAEVKTAVPRLSVEIRGQVAEPQGREEKESELALVGGVKLS